MSISKKNKKYEGDYVKIDIDTIHILRKLGVKNGNEIILFSKILSLSNNQNGACTAGNEYLANILGVSERSIQDYIRDLKKIGIIKTYEQKVGCKTTTRFIYPQSGVDEAHEESFTQYVTEHTQTSAPTTRRITSEDTKNHVKPHEGLRQTTRRGLHPIIEYNRIEENRIEDGSYEPCCSAEASQSVARAKEIAAELRSINASLPIEEYKFDAALPDKDIRDIIINTFERDYDENKDDMNYWREQIIKEFISKTGHYQCKNIDATEQFVDFMFDKICYLLR